jgi:hypothetical protein
MNEPDDRWLLLRERGGDVSHVSASARARYEQLAELIQALPGEAPRPGWKARVVVEFDKPRPRANARCWHTPHCAVWIAVAALAITGPTAAVVVASRGPASQEPQSVFVTSVNSHAAPVVASPSVLSTHDPQVIVAIRRHGAPLRGGASRGPAAGTAEIAAAQRVQLTHVGDTLVLHVKADPAFELRVYGNAGEPLARCATVLDCSLELILDEPRLRLEVPLRAPGRVSVQLFAGTSIPISFQDLNTDLVSAQNAMVGTREVAVVHVD